MKLFKTIKSIRFAIVIIIIIAIISAIGAFIPQERTSDFYTEKYGKSLAILFEFSQFTDVFHSLYFIILLGLLSLSLILCSFDRFKVIKKYLKIPDKTRFNKEKLKSDDFYKVFKGEFDIDNISNQFKRRLYKSKKINDEFLFLRKGFLKKFNFLFVHLGVLIIILSGIIGWGWGENAYIYIFEGGEIAIPEEISKNLTIYAEKVDIKTDPNSGNILSYESYVELKKYGKEVYKREILVNSPLKYEGFKIYQEEMNKGKGIRLFFKNLSDSKVSEDAYIDHFQQYIPIQIEYKNSDKKNIETKEMKKGDVKPISGLNLYIKVVEIYTNYLNISGQIYNNNPNEYPAIKYELIKNDEVLSSGYAFEKTGKQSIVHNVDDASIQIKILPKAKLIKSETSNLVPIGLNFPLPYTEEEGKIEVDKNNKKRIFLRYNKKSVILKKFHPEIIDISGVKLGIIYTGIESGDYTGLTIKKDPGRNVFYAGVFVLSLSVLLMFFSNYTRIKIVVGENSLIMSAKTNRSIEKIEEEINTIVLNMKRDFLK
jgi:cytochrome c biogenesis protein ResB